MFEDGDGLSVDMLGLVGVKGGGAIGSGLGCGFLAVPLAMLVLLAGLAFDVSFRHGKG
jgi:hypothetical protein